MMRFYSAALAATLMTASGAASAVPMVTDDPILFWNQRAVANVAASPFVQTRTFAMVNIAMHDAVNLALGRPNKSYLGNVGITPGGDTRAAASQAARDVLVALNPANAAQYDAALAQSLALVTDGKAKDKGIKTGAAYAAAVLAKRATDGSTASVTYATTGLPGDWRPTSAGNPAAPHWGDVMPFVLASGDQFRPGPPPALDSAEYAAAYNEVKEIGSATSATRTPDQTASALFWDVSNGATWLGIGLTVAEDEGLSTIEYARAFALLTTGVADALIAGFDAKYEYRLWRPVTAIREGDTDGNAATTADAAWAPLFGTPLHPTYISTHSALSGVASTILLQAFGDEGFTYTIAGDTRSFTGLEQAALDGANSRLWGGIHFRFDNEAGLLLGQNIGRQAIDGPLFDAVPEPGTVALMLGGLGFAQLLRRRRRHSSGGATAWPV